MSDPAAVVNLVLSRVDYLLDDERENDNDRASNGRMTNITSANYVHIALIMHKCHQPLFMNVNNHRLNGNRKK